MTADPDASVSRPFPLLTILVAMTRQGVIGRQGQLPWHLPEELALFRNLTWGHTLIMGRCTYEAIGRPLPGRRNLVVSSSLPLQENVEICETFSTALNRAAAERNEVFFVGGRQIYRQALPLADCLAVSWIRQNHSGEVRFPDIDWSCWRKVDRKSFADFIHVRYCRHDPADSETRRDGKC